MSSQPEWYAPGLRFTCTQCGNCCSGPPGYVWFDDSEEQAIAAFLGINTAEFRGRYTDTHKGKGTIKDHLTPDGYDCVFLRRDHSQATCAIYPVRPQQCRSWPFWDDNLASRSSWQRTAQRCPGMSAGLAGQGVLYPIAQIRIIRAGHNHNV